MGLILEFVPSKLVWNQKHEARETVMGVSNWLHHNNNVWPIYSSRDSGELMPAPLAELSSYLQR